MTRGRQGETWGRHGGDKGDKGETRGNMGETCGRHGDTWGYGEKHWGQQLAPEQKSTKKDWTKYITFKFSLTSSIYKFQGRHLLLATLKSCVNNIIHAMLNLLISADSSTDTKMGRKGEQIKI